MFCHCSLFTSPLSYHFPPFLLLTPRPERPKKNTAGCGHGKNALWDAKRAWRPTYSLAIRSSNWLGKVWQTTKKGIYIYIHDRKRADIKNKVSLLRWLACGHELFVSMFCCFVPMLKWKFEVWYCWSKVFPMCFDHLEWQRWNMKATALSRGHDFKMMKREQVITKILTFLLWYRMDAGKKIRSVKQQFIMFIPSKDSTKKTNWRFFQTPNDRTFW